MDIVVLCGGLSTERDVSLKSGAMIAGALRESGHRVVLIDSFFGYVGPAYSDPKEIFDRPAGGGAAASVVLVSSCAHRAITASSNAAASGCHHFI